MCKLIKHTHTACSHADRDGRARPNNDTSENDVGFIRFCEAARKEADENQEKTKLCNGMKREDLYVEWYPVNGMCKRCLDARGIYRSKAEKARREECLGKEMMMERFLSEEAQNIEDAEKVYEYAGW